jgi:hypothetical protein
LRDVQMLADPSGLSTTQHYPDAGGEDYVFLPGYSIRDTAVRIVQRQFNHLMERTGLKHDPITNTDRTI